MTWLGAVVITVLAGAGTFLTLDFAAFVRAKARSLDFHTAFGQVTQDPVNLGGAQGVGFLIALAIGIAALRGAGSVRETLALAPVRNRVLVFALIAGVALQFPLAELGNLLQGVWPTRIEEQWMRLRLVTPDDLPSALAILFAVVLVAPVSEELLFRGLLLPSLRAAHGTGPAWIVSSLLFGLCHLDPAAFVYATVAGAFLGGVAIATGSTLPCIAMHAAVNAVPLLLPARLVRIPGFNTVSERVYHLPLPLLASSMVVPALPAR